MSQPVNIYTSTRRPDCWRAKSFLKHHGISFQEIKIEEVEGAAEFVIAANNGRRRVPTFDFQGRIFHCSHYDSQKLARELAIETIPTGQKI